MRDRVVESRDGIVHFAVGRGQRRRERDEGKGGEGEAGHGPILSKDEGGSTAVIIEDPRFRWGDRRVDLLQVAMSLPSTNPHSREQMRRWQRRSPERKGDHEPPRSRYPPRN